ncbi:MAG: carboxypeptidase regulatory-like domain-containing protein [Ilumatobacteraceae bacterium]
MFIQVRPATLEIAAGASAEVEVTVIDPPAGVPGRLEVLLAGVEPEWVTRVDGSPDDMSLRAVDGRLVARLSVAVPGDHPATERLLAVGVRPEGDRRGAAFERLPLRVVDRVPVRVSTDPSIATGGSRVEARLVIANDSDRELVVTPVGEDDEGVVGFRFERERIEVPGSSHRSVGVRITGSRPIVGASVRRTVRVGVDVGERVLVDLPVVRRPVLPTWSLVLVALVIGLVSALVLGDSSVFDRAPAAAHDPVVLAPADGSGGGVAELDLPGGAITGSVIDASVGDPVAGALVELFAVDDPVDTLTTAATDADGRWRLGGVAPGEFTVRVSASGFAAVWLGGVERFTEAASVTVTGDASRPVDVEPVVLDGEAGSVSGRLIGADLGGLVVTATPTGGDAPVASAVVDAGSGGVFSLAPLPTPGRFVIRVAGGSGETLTEHTLALAAGRDDTSLALVVPQGPGRITGTVVTGAGPLGGATVEVADGRSTIRTIALTQGAVGSFAVDGLSVPGRYTVTVARPGFAAESLAVDLTAVDPAVDLEVPLVTAAGTVTGRVVGPDSVGIGGVEVRATSDGVDVVSASIDGDTDLAGTFTLVGLPIPGTYTLTFGVDGRRPVTREVRLTADSRPAPVTVTMIQEAVMVAGTVTGPDGAGLGRVTMVLSDGVRVRSSTSADEPLGRFEFSAVAPGSYTLTARRPGAEPVVVLVSVPDGVAEGAGLDVEVPVSVGPAAAVTGRAVIAGSVPAPGVIVRLFRLADYPGAASAAVATAVADADGRFTLSGFEAPADLVVAVYASATATSASVTVSTRPAVATTTDVGEVLVP